MYLHKDKEAFHELVIAASEELNIPGDIIEKDYYVSLVLHGLHKANGNIMFRGGTSLSKCYGIIDRFSEDIDISIIPEAEKMTEGKRKKLKYSIVDTMTELGLEMVNLEDTKSRRDYNKYIARYDSIYCEYGIVNAEIIIDTYIAVRPFPYHLKPVSNYIYETLIKLNRHDIIDKFELDIFEMYVQDMRRTLIDKVFALCDYYMQGKVKKHSRHIYDIYKMIPLIIFDDNFSILVKEAREIRKGLPKCPSAQDGIVIGDYLNEIVENEIYREDYEDLTMKLLFRKVDYDEAIEGLCLLIRKDFFR